MSRNSRSKQPKQATSEEKQFSSTIITNFLNNYYRNAAMKNPSAQALNFKVYPTEKASKIPQQSVIDLYEYQGLLDFIETYKVAQQIPEDKLPQNKLTEFVIERTFDMKLRACLDSARVFKTNDKSKLNVFQEFVIPQLGFERSSFMNIVDYINGVSSYFASDTKLKTKIYNLIFPHDSHNPDKLPVGVNVIYLQHVSKYHDEVLDMVVNQGLSELEVLKECQKKYAADSGLSTDIQQQLINERIAELVLEPPMTADKRGKPAINFKSLVEELDAVEAKPVKKGKKIVSIEFSSLGRKLNKEECKAVRALVRELMIVKSFVKIINGGKNARKVEKNSAGEDVAVPLNPDLKQCLVEYNEVYEKTINFYNYWKKTVESELARIETEKDKVKYNQDEVDESKLDELVALNEQKLQYQLFLRYFVETVRFIKNELGYTQAFKSFINDVKKDVIFKFNKGLRTKLENLVNQEEKVTPEQIEELANEHFKDWMFINSPKTYNPNDLAVYSKIGKFCQLEIKKEYRVAVGIAIVAFIQQKIALIQAANRKKKELQLYIKV